MPIWRTTYHAQKYSATMHDYYLVTLSEPLIFLGFSMVSGILTMGVIWREESASKIDYFRADIIILTYGKHSSIKGFSDYS